MKISIPEEEDTNPYFPTLSHEAALVEVIERIGRMSFDQEIPKTSRVLMEQFPDHERTGDRLLSRLLETMSSSLISPTIIHGGSRNTHTAEQVRAEVTFDCRLLPGITEESFMKNVEQALSGMPAIVEIKQFTEGYEADVDKKIITLMEKALKEHDHSITSLIPFITPGSNDGKFLKPLGCDVLGFAPLHRDEPFTAIMPLIHGIDERISVTSLRFCEQVLQDVCTGYLIGDMYID